MNVVSMRSDWRRPSPGASILFCAVLTALVAWLRLVVFQHSSVGIGYGLPIVLVGWTRRRRFVWGMCAVFAAMAAIKFVLNAHVSELPLNQRIVNFLLLMGDLLVVAGIVDLVIRREAAFHLRGQDLYRREQELKMSNEGLLERQQTMEILLKLSRALTVGQNRQEIFAAIAQTIRLLLGASAAAALWEARGQNVEMTVHEGFGKNGPETLGAPRGGIFAGVVMEQQKTVALGKLSQRPELAPERIRHGEPFNAMLGAPLKSGPDVVGALVIYSPQPRGWTESDVSLVESLAAQASVSIAATSLVEQLEDEHRELQTIVDAVPFGILRTDARASRLICNPAAADMLGFPEIVEAESRDWPKMTLIGPKGDIPQGRDPLLRALHGEVIAAMELDVRLADGETFRTLCNAAPIRDRSGAITGAVSAFVDISSHKSMREELDRRSRQDEDASSRKSRFLAAVNHDVRNPANAINLLAELLRKAARDPAQIAGIPEIARQMERTSNSLVSLVSHALELVRLDLGPPEINETEIEVGPWVEELCSRFQPLAQQKNLEFIVTKPVSNICLRVDKAKLARVLGILVDNAIKFTQQGEVRVEAILMDDRTLRFEVTDTGIGIAADSLNSIFDELTQLKSAQRAKTGGSGLGLAISRRLVELMDGKLEVASEPGKGSTFSFFLPASNVFG
ncbi:MAG: ATP-binding protein [Tepidisphaeraceae bacterium]|jgi:PAS domain S-box-containing protein